MTRPDENLRVEVKQVRRETHDIQVYELADRDGANLPPFTAGSHIVVEVPGGLRRQYSLCNDPREMHRYVVAVLREANGRGGSKAMHDRVVAGTTINISNPRNDFPLDETAERHVLIAGGIGITPLLSMARRLSSIEADYTLHYCTRSPENTAFVAELHEVPLEGHVTFHHDGGMPSQGLDVAGLLAQVDPGTHVYCCGPAGLINAVRGAAKAWPAESIHFELFKADPDSLARPETSFEIEIASTGKTYLVPEGKSILQVLREHGYALDSNCEQGTCGTCLVQVLDGKPDHRDTVLTDEERDAGNLMAICCSRSKGGRLKLEI